MSNFIPDGWEIKSIDEVATVFAGGTPSRSKPEYYVGNIPWVKSGEVNARLIYRTEETISDIAVKESSAKWAKSGSVLVAMYGATAGKVAKLMIDATLNQAVSAINGKHGATDNDFLLYAIESNSRELLNTVQGSGQPNLSGQLIKSLSFPVPPLPEQQKIATILSSVDDVIEKTRAQIDKLKDLKTGMMQELLTKGIGHTEFKDSPVGRIPVEWEVFELNEICTSKYAIVDGPFGSNLKTEHYRPDGIPVFQSGFVTSGRFVKREYVYVDQEKYNEQIRSSAMAGDILMAKIGMNAGACAIIPKGHPVGILAGNSLKITVDNEKMLNTYLLSVLQLMRYTGEMRRLLTETAQPAVSITTLKRLKIAVPPLREQNEISNTLSSVDLRFTILTERLVHFLNIKKALMQDLLTGKVRVKLTDLDTETAS